MNDSVTERADAQHPWIGLASFTEGDREFFAGRGDEIDDLLRLVRRDTLTLLYGVSGLGKTSLVQAGLFPALREGNFLPVPIRLDYLEGAASLAEQIISAITAAAVAARVEAPQPRPNETLWEYFHREGNHFWSSRNDLVTPFLAFDQFEEFFTLGRENPARVARAGAFIGELADLIEDRPPALLRDDPLRAKEFNFKPAPLKVLLAMREDYLADLDRIRSHFRALGQNRLRLLPMGERQARQVIALGAPLLAPGVEDRIVSYVAGGAAEAGEMTVAPALLSLVLRELNERRLARGPEAKITSDLLDVEQHKIFEDFYLRTLQDFPAGLRLFIEDELLTASGHRNSCALDDALTKPDVTLPVLNELVNRRLLAYEDRHHTRRVELTHDVLVPVIKASRDSRLTREALAQAERHRAEQVAQKRKQRLTLAVACALALTLIATIWGGYYVFVQEHKAYYSDVAKQRGFPVGVRRVSESEARRLATSYLLVQKGVTREGWKFRWKPAFRMVAVNSQLEPTTSHTIGTYLWQKDDSGDTTGDQSQKRAEQLGLHTVCQWEYDSNADGQIMYERALDQDGRMVFGFIYSPPGSGPSDTRLARFVGPDGFPQLQHNSAAEYVSIHYNSEGWEDRYTYRDGKNLPAAGPDGGFGRSLGYNSIGQNTLRRSLDADGKFMIDSAGNCGMDAIYNGKGWLTELRSIGTDGNLMEVKDGWAVLKRQCDDFGRVRRATLYGLKSEPVLHKEGYHGWELEYDEHGNTISSTVIGLDGKPTLLPQGIAAVKSLYNAQGKATRTSFYGVRGEPVLHKDGNQAREVQYDARGNPIAMTYLGLDGKPVIISVGYASSRAIYDTRGRKTQETYYGIHREPVAPKDANHGWQSKFDERGNDVETTFLGRDGKPAILAAGYAIIKRKYDSDGYELEFAYFDAAGKPALELDSRVHKVINGYDGRGKVIHRRFRGIKDEPILRKDGGYGWDSQYDERGNDILDTIVGLDERPIFLLAGYAIMKFAYDASGRKIRTSLHGINGERVLHKDGYHGSKSQYDERGNEIERTYFGLDEKPVRLPAGYATFKWRYDIRGKIIQGTYYDVDGEPILSQDAYHGWKSKYDQHGNETVTTYLGVDEKPKLLADGYAIIRTDYDCYGHSIQTTYHGIADEPVMHKDGSHGLKSQYDERGNLVTATFIDSEGKPISIDAGFATKKMGYDTRGKTTRVTFYGANGDAVQLAKGYHGWESKYDDCGHEIATTYIAVDGKPVQLLGRYATMKTDYDDQGRVARATYYDVEDKPVLDRDGYHGWESEYDERGNESTTVFLGVNEKPALVPNGYAILRMTFDVRGNITRRTYHGVDGEGVVSTDGYHGWEAKYDEAGKQVAKTYIGLDGKPVQLKQGKQR